MSRTNGYILLHKQIADKDSWLWNDKPFSRGQAWIDLLLMANYQDQKVVLKGQVVELKRGQLIRGTDNLAERWGWSRNKVLRTLDWYAKEGMIQKNGTRNGTLITIENYEKYQTLQTPSETPDGTPDGTRINKYNKYNKEGVFDPPPSADVFLFFQEHNYVSDPEQFYGWYESTGWTKKNGDPVKDWKSLARSWEQREKLYAEERKGKSQSKGPAPIEPPKYPEFEPEPERKAEPMDPEQRQRYEDMKKELLEATT